MLPSALGDNPVPDVEDLVAWADEAPQLRRQLLSWYCRERRRLPWRGDAPPWCDDKAAHREAQASRAAKPEATLSVASFKRRIQASKASEPIDLEEPELRPDCEHLANSPSVAAARGAFTPSAYGTWVSEVMLQQTQVERVVAYWTRWMERFPTISVLADSDLDAVNSIWAGLGFYGRARRLHEGARYVLRVHDGQVPDDLESLLKIPGVGPYTAGAIASIAFGRREAIVDGNIIRVFARLRALDGDATSPRLTRRCWMLAKELVDPDSPCLFNQALMELGATVCTPKAPACIRCPVREHCAALKLTAAGKVKAVVEFPAKAVKKPPKVKRFAAAVLDDDQGRFLLVRRPLSGLLAGQWEFPTVEILPCEDGESEGSMPNLETEDALRARLGTCGSVAQGRMSDIVLANVPPVVHTFSHERHTTHIYCAHVSAGAAASLAEIDAPPAAPSSSSWMSPLEASTAGVTSGVQKMFSALGLSSSPRPRVTTLVAHRGAHSRRASITPPPAKRTSTEAALLKLNGSASLLDGGGS